MYPALYTRDCHYSYFVFQVVLQSASVHVQLTKLFSFTSLEYRTKAYSLYCENYDGVFIPQSFPLPKCPRSHKVCFLWFRNQSSCFQHRELGIPLCPQNHWLQMLGLTSWPHQAVGQVSARLNLPQESFSSMAQVVTGETGWEGVPSPSTASKGQTPFCAGLWGSQLPHELVYN